jgi:hypothetical protein
MARFQPALLGGLFIGVLSALPVVSAANACCCLWVVVGGVLTAYLQQSARPEPLDTGEAALGGLIAGVVGAVLYLLVLVLMLSGEIGQSVTEQLRAALESNPQIPTEVRDRVLAITAGGSFVLLFGVIMVPVYGVFAMLGALLGVNFFRKKVLPPTA